MFTWWTKSRYPEIKMSVDFKLGVAWRSCIIPADRNSPEKLLEVFIQHLKKLLRHCSLCFYFFFKLFTSCDVCSSNYPGKKLLVDFLHDLHCFFLKKMMLVVFNLSKYNNGHRHRLFSFYYSENVTSFLIVCMGGTRIPKFLNCQQMNVFFFFMVFIISWKSKFFLK